MLSIKNAMQIALLGMVFDATVAWVPAKNTIPKRFFFSHHDVVLTAPHSVDRVAPWQPASAPTWNHDETIPPTTGAYGKDTPNFKRVVRGIDLRSMSWAEKRYSAAIPLWLIWHAFCQALALGTSKKLSFTTNPIHRVQSMVACLVGPFRTLQLLARPGQTVLRENGPLVCIDGNISHFYQECSDRMAFLVQEDLKNIRAGIYPIPSELDMFGTIVFRQNFLLEVAKAIMKGIKDIMRAFKFAKSDANYSGDADYSKVNTATHSVELPQTSTKFNELAKGLNLPEYYTEFHSVPGGFLSPDHAKIYDLLSETVFSGSFKMGRRMTLPPVVRYARQQGNTQGKGMLLLDLGTATGTYLIQVREVLKDIKLEGIDLSPSFLREAEVNYRKHPVTKGGVNPPNFERANMEMIPRDDSSMDIITQVNCFHEMPEYAIRNTIQQIARVLKPNGLFVHSDALQMKDDKVIASATDDTFRHKFNEPFLKDWQEKIDLDAICREHGLVPDEAPRTYKENTVRTYRKLR